MTINYNLGLFAQKVTVNTTANSISVTSSNTISVPNITVGGTIAANGSSNTGTAGYILTSGGSSTNAYWAAISVNTSAQYTFTNTITVNAPFVVSNTFSANGGVGTAGQVLTSNGATGSPYWAAISVNTSASYTWTNTHTFNSLVTLSGNTTSLSALLTNAGEPTTISATAATGTINYDISTQSVLYYTTNASANWTVNFRGSSGTSLNTLMSTGQTVTVVFLVTQGTTAYYNSAVQVDGSAVTPKWQGGSAPSAGNASGIDIYAYTIIKTGSAAFTVLASLTQFK
jgi:hypothetical protein